MRKPALSEWTEFEDARLDAPAFHRNHAALTAVLERELAAVRGDLLELGCGSGQHALAIAQALPGLVVWPTDPDPRHCASADAWRASTTLANLRPARVLDARSSDWLSDGPQQPVAAVLCANVIHISPWSVACALFAGAARHLADDGKLMLYGPFKQAGKHGAASNASFDASLRARDPSWGIRDLVDLDALAAEHDLQRTARHAMPANNHTLVYAPVAVSRRLS